TRPFHWLQGGKDGGELLWNTPSLPTSEVDTSVDEGGGDQKLSLGRPSAWTVREPNRSSLACAHRIATSLLGSTDARRSPAKWGWTNTSPRCLQTTNRLRPRSSWSTMVRDEDNTAPARPAACRVHQHAMSLALILCSRPRLGLRRGGADD